jgi:hypothetical protein
LALWALTAGRSGLAGAAVAAACFARPATAPAAGFLGLYLIHCSLLEWTSSTGTQRRTGLASFIAGGAMAGLAGILYNYWLFGNLLGGAPLRAEIWFREFGTRNMFAGSLPEGFAGLTISPSRGLLIYSPITLVALHVAFKAWRSPARTDLQSAFGQGDAILMLRYVSLAALSILLMYSKSIFWWGGHGFGPRYLTDAMPFVGLLFAPGLLPSADTALVHVSQRWP